MAGPFRPACTSRFRHGSLLAEIMTRMVCGRALTGSGGHASRQLFLAAHRGPKPKHQSEKSSWELNEAAIGGELTG